MKLVLRKTYSKEIKAEASRRILARYPIWKQVNLMREGGAAAEEMARFIDAVRAASDAIEAMTPQPSEFADEKYWPQ